MRLMITYNLLTRLAQRLVELPRTIKILCAASCDFAVCSCAFFIATALYREQIFQLSTESIWVAVGFASLAISCFHMTGLYLIVCRFGELHLLMLLLQLQHFSIMLALILHHAISSLLVGPLPEFGGGYRLVFGGVSIPEVGVIVIVESTGWWLHLIGIGGSLKLWRIPEFLLCAVALGLRELGDIEMVRLLFPIYGLNDNIIFISIFSIIWFLESVSFIKFLIVELSRGHHIPRMIVRERPPILLSGAPSTVTIWVLSWWWVVRRLIHFLSLIIIIIIGRF